MCLLCASLNPTDLHATETNHLSDDVTFGNWVSVFGGVGGRAPRPVSASLDPLAAQLTTGYWASQGGAKRSFDLDSSREVTVDLSGLESAEERAVATAALAAWTDVSGIVFVNVGAGSGAQITFDNNDPQGAYSTSATSGGRIISSNVNIPTDWDKDPISVNSYWMQTYMHEIGHSIGLGHAGNYNGSAIWGRSNKFANDSWQASVMSYFSQPQNPNTGASYAFTATPMAADIIAIQSLYGTNVQTRSGDTVYGNNSNVDGYLGDLFDQWLGGAAAETKTYIGNPITLTLFDTGGIDTLDVSGISVAQRIDLNAEAKSDVAGLKGNIIIARGTVIENAIGGNGDDTLSGNAAANTLTGGEGADRIDGRAGNDTLIGGNGNDTLIGGSGDDLMVSGAGADSFDGGTEFDAVSYDASAGAVTVDLDSVRLNTGDAAGDTYSSIEFVIGGSASDILRGSTGAELLRGMIGDDQLFGRSNNDTLEGGAGDDLLVGGKGADVLDGGEGRDRADYSDAGTGVTASLAAAAALAATAPLVAYGSPLGGGFLALTKGGGDGGYVVPTSGGRGRGRGRATGDDAKGDTFHSVEDLSGSAFNDNLTGDSLANAIWGNNGNDVLNGGLGNDTLTGGAGSDTFVFNGGTDTVTDFLDNIDTISIARSLFATPTVSIAQALALATVEGGNIVFHFNDVDTFILNGITDINALQDDLIFV
jgi:serralysin